MSTSKAYPRSSLSILIIINVLAAHSKINWVFLYCSLCRLFTTNFKFYVDSFLWVYLSLLVPELQTCDPQIPKNCFLSKAGYKVFGFALTHAISISYLSLPSHQLTFYKYVNLSSLHKFFFYQTSEWFLVSFGLEFCENLMKAVGLCSQKHVNRNQDLKSYRYLGLKISAS